MCTRSQHRWNARGLALQELEAAIEAASSSAAEKKAEVADAAQEAEVLTEEVERLKKAAEKNTAEHQEQARLSLTAFPWHTQWACKTGPALTEICARAIVAESSRVMFQALTRFHAARAPCGQRASPLRHPCIAALLLPPCAQAPHECDRCFAVVWPYKDPAMLCHRCRLCSSSWRPRSQPPPRLSETWRLQRNRPPKQRRRRTRPRNRRKASARRWQNSRPATQRLHRACRNFANRYGSSSTVQAVRLRSLRGRQHQCALETCRNHRPTSSMLCARQAGFSYGWLLLQSSL